VPRVSPFHHVKNCSRNFFIAILVAGGWSALWRSA